MAGRCSDACTAIEAKFGVELAEREVAAYHRKGPGRTTRLLRDGIVAAGGPGETLLDVGAGFGPLTFELLELGARRATDVDASEVSLAAGRGEAERRNRAAQIEWRHGDFVDLAEGLEPADTVTLDRVVCCYPHYKPLLGAAAAHARHRLAVSYPRDVWFVRLGLALMNRVRALKGETFRTHLHSPLEMELLIRGHGFVPSVRRTTWLWCADVYSKAGASA